MPAMTSVLLAAFLATNSIAFVDSRVTVSNPTNSLCRFVDYEASCRTQNFVLNTNFWLRGIDFSCVSPWNSGSGRLRAGTAISKRHIVFGKHYPLWKDVRIVFVGEDGGVCPCSIVATKELPNTDIAIGLLNAELTPNIHPAKILPRNAAEYIGDGTDFPVVTFNQFENAFLTYVRNVRSLASDFLVMWCREPTDPRQCRFRKPIKGGDSGNPAFLLFNGQPILLFTLYGGGCGTGHCLHAACDEIQSAMDALCPGYRLETFDFGKGTGGAM